ncbi:MAG: alpha/beta hydrolase [Planctomycetota bacterium]
MRRTARRVALWIISILVALSLLSLLATRALVRQSERALPPSGKFLEIQGAMQHVVIRGEGRPIVFVHGAFGMGQEFLNTVVPLLEGEAQCIVWDRPGHGYSERPEEVDGPLEQGAVLCSLLEELSLSEAPLVVGFSYGGAVALCTAIRPEAELAGLVLLNSPAYTWPDPLDLEYRVPSVPVLGPLLTETLATPLGFLARGDGLKRAFAPDLVPEGFDDRSVRLALRPASYRANAEDVQHLKSGLIEASKRYADLTLPIVLLQAQDDGVVSPVLHAPRLHETAPNTTYVPLEGTGHQILYAQTDRVVRAIREALAAN